MGKLSFRHTRRACYAGYITVAAVNNLAPLLFLTFQRTFGLSLDAIALLITVNFGVQLLTDLLSTRFVDKIGYRASIVAAQLLAAAGLVGLAVFPAVFPSPYAGLLAAVVLYAVGGGLDEVLISPIVEACPSDHKAAEMSMLHSFYAWGHVLVVALSTLFFAAAGLERWRVLACLWALLPLGTAAVFLRVPINQFAQGEARTPMRKLFSKKLFWLMLLFMLCAGAAEQAMAQWASAFAESGLGVSKTAGDLAGPCCFAVLTGVSRVFYAKRGPKIDLRNFMLACGGLCVAAYLLAALSPVPALALVGCALCGLAVGILWPGTISLAATACPAGGTALFALLALAADAGCSAGPAVVGLVSGAAVGRLQSGLLAGLIFPVILTAGLLCYRNLSRKDVEHGQEQ